MRFVNKISYSLAKAVQVRLNESHQKRYVYYYGFQTIVGSIVKGIVLVTSSLILDLMLKIILDILIRKVKSGEITLEQIKLQEYRIAVKEAIE